uniref:Elicitin-like protein n=1 Tax=Macrostomum lignano TaxID=282301 RepID=A0A1I8ITG1_9PLAT
QFEKYYSQRFWISHSNARMNIVTFMQLSLLLTVAVVGLQTSSGTSVSCHEMENLRQCSFDASWGDFQSGGESSLAHFVTQCELARCTDDSVTINREVPWPIDSTAATLHVAVDEPNTVSNDSDPVSPSDVSDS